jgi:hypothetical protein
VWTASGSVAIHGDTTTRRVHDQPGAKIISAQNGAVG